MIDALEKFFENARGRRLVARELLRLGLKVDGKGKIYVGNIEVPPAKIGRALKVDRRVVIETANAIAQDDKLLHIFYRLESRAFLGNAAKELGFDTIELRANPEKSGIISAVTDILAQNKIVIRQIVSDDPYLFPDPVLTIIINGRLSAKVIKKIKELPFATGILIK